MPCASTRSPPRVGSVIRRATIRSSRTASSSPYAVVIEKVGGNYSAYVPDLPGCVADGDSIAEVEYAIREAI
jgi:hypothetical protein